MRSSLYRAIFYLGNPLLVLSYVLLLMMAINPYAFGAHYVGDKRTMVLLLYVLSTTFLIPALGVSMLKPLGLIPDLEMQDKQQRTGPYIITGIFYLWAFKNFMGGAVPLLFAKFVLGATIGLFFAFFANIFFKISAHTTGMGALLGMLLLLPFEWRGEVLGIGPVLLSLNVVLAFALLFAGLVGTAQIALGRQTLAEVIQGYVAGFAAVMLANLIL